MTLLEYNKATKRTLPDLGSLEKNVIHMEMGIITEVGEIIDPFKKQFAYGKEIDIVNVGEEIADLSWYLSNKVNLDTGKPLITNFTEEEAIKNFIDMERFAEIAEENKYELIVSIVVEIQKGTIYSSGHYKAPQACFEALSLCCSLLGLSYFEQLDKNIRKLKARFPDKFDADKAINRDLEAERKELEN